MRKPELAAAIAERAELSKDKASQVLNVILDEITGSVAQGQDVSLIGFGTFTVRERAARTGKNPQTGQPLAIPPARPWPSSRARGSRMPSARADARPRAVTLRPAPAGRRPPACESIPS